MKLTYRGVPYVAQAATAVRDAGIGGKYRGQFWHRFVPTQAPTPQPLYQLKYRGVPYTIGEIEPKVTVTTRDRVRARRILDTLKPQISLLHRANLQHNIEHRLEVARAQGNAVLVKMLEREFDDVMS
ncbi:MAG: hypothetical protein RLZZ511_1747 [Cyanobacteriota bacterium]|jgi:Domain of unknown function (DUF4278)